MTLLRARCSVRRERLLRERPFSIRSRRGCSPVSTLRLDSSGERPNSSLSGISKEPVQTKSLQMAVITEINGASSSAAGTELQITRKRTYKKRAKKNARNKVDSPQWGDLPPELLALIAERVAIPGFFSLAHVSRAFRASALSVKREFLGSKGPLVAVITSRATRSCFFFSTASWGGRTNCIYYLGYQEECLVYSATNPPVLIDRFPITPGNKGRAAKVWHGWYMPNEALGMNCVWDDRYPPPPVAPA